MIDKISKPKMSHLVKRMYTAQDIVQVFQDQ